MGLPELSYRSIKKTYQLSINNFYKTYLQLRKEHGQSVNIIPFFTLHNIKAIDNKVIIQKGSIFELFEKDTHDSMGLHMKNIMNLIYEIVELDNTVISYSDINYIKLLTLSYNNITIQLELFFIRECILHNILLHMIKTVNDSSNKPDNLNLSNIKLGIFGSIYPTSDIDIGFINYSQDSTVCLYYILNIFEDLFIYFTKCNSLQFNIESYANLMTLRGPITGTNLKKLDYFYLTTHDFDIDDFCKLLPYLGASILRNLSLAYFEVNSEHSKRTHFIKKFIMNARFDDISEFALLLNTIKLYNISLYEVLIDNEWQRIAKDLILSYLLLSYNKKRRTYYKLIKNAETEIARAINNTGLLDKKERLKIIELYAHTLIFREESYVLSPTIVHVVRIIQTNRMIHKRKCIYPTNIPNCSLGPIGYLCSMFEQIGYLARFRLKHCEKNRLSDINIMVNKNKCSRMINKYYYRLYNAIKNFADSEDSEREFNKYLLYIKSLYHTKIQDFSKHTKKQLKKSNKKIHLTL
jgi:hypothetical protein